MGQKAGVAGLEPANAGVKVPCLTTWLHPNAGCLHRRSQQTEGKTKGGVTSGARTHDIQSHNLALYH